MNRRASIAVGALLFVSGATLLSGPHSSNAQSKPDPEHGRAAVVKDSENCTKTEKFFGEVKRHQDVEQSIGGGLIFRLAASYDRVIEGWTIEIKPRDADRSMGPNWAWMLNPPYHGYNATDLNASYDFTAKMAVEFSPRELRFPLTAAEAARARELVGVLGSNTGPVFDKALKEMETMRSGKAVFRIVDSKLGESGPENGGRGRIEWLKFELRITFPCDFPPG
jgi:hypothetical protein